MKISALITALLLAAVSSPASAQGTAPIDVTTRRHGFDPDEKYQADMLKP